MNCLNRYSCSSGQFINREKSKVYDGSIAANRMAQITSLRGIGIGHLGVPLFMGKPKKIYLQPLADRIKVRLATWKGLLLYAMGRVQLVQSVIQSMLLHYFRVYV